TSSIDRATKRFYRPDGTRPAAPPTEPSRDTVPIDAPWEEGEADLVESSELASGSVPVPEGTGDENEDVRTILLRLEKTVVAQGKSFRALVELLQEKGLLRRGELG